MQIWHIATINRFFIDCFHLNGRWGFRPNCQCHSYSDGVLLQDQRTGVQRENKGGYTQYSCYTILKYGALLRF